MKGLVFAVAVVVFLYNVVQLIYNLFWQGHFHPGFLVGVIISLIAAVWGWSESYQVDSADEA